MSVSAIAPRGVLQAILCLAVLALAPLFFAESASAAIEVGTVTGTVYDSSTNQPLQDVRVEFWSSDGSLLIDHAYTDSTGHYALQLVTLFSPVLVYFDPTEHNSSHSHTFAPEWYQDQATSATAWPVTFDAWIPAGVDGYLAQTEVKTPTDLTFQAPATSAYGSAKVSGYLKDEAGDPLPSRSVIIWYYSGGWKEAATVTTSSDGSFSSTTNPTVKTTYRASFVATGAHEGTTSQERTVLPRVRLTRSTSWRVLSRGRAYYSTGYIQPKHARTDPNKVKIRVYKKSSNGKYRYVKAFKASFIPQSSTKTKYRAKVVFPSRGKWKLIAYHGEDSRNARTNGRVDYFTVK